MPFWALSWCPFAKGHQFCLYKGTVLVPFVLKRAPFFKTVPKGHCFGSIFFLSARFIQLYWILHAGKWITNWTYDSVYGKRVLPYWENRRNLDGLIVPMENYVFLERWSYHKAIHLAVIRNSPISPKFFSTLVPFSQILLVIQWGLNGRWHIPISRFHTPFSGMKVSHWVCPIFHSALIE